MRNGKRYYRQADKYAKTRKKMFIVIVIFAVTLDVVAGIAMLLNATQVLYFMQNALSPVAWLFEMIRIPIRDGFIEGAYPLLYYRVLLLVSALAGTMCCVVLTWAWCKRYRFFQNPIYCSLGVQRMIERHRDFFKSELWFYFLFSRGLYISLIYLTANILFYIYPGRITFHANKHSDIIVPIIFTLLPGLCWSVLPTSVFALISCICNDLRTIKIKFNCH
jgi:hypothetical protein